MLELNGIRKTYVTGTTSVEALKRDRFEVP